MCGEKSTGILVWLEVIGSPPRMRGKAARLCLFSFFLGIAPAYAGKRICFASWKAKEKDHPRVCGEKRQHLRQCNACSGSPPRMRGKARMAFVALVCNRITPAYAGKSIRAYVKIWNE